MRFGGGIWRKHDHLHRRASALAEDRQRNSTGVSARVRRARPATVFFRGKTVAVVGGGNTAMERCSSPTFASKVRTLSIAAMVLGRQDQPGAAVRQGQTRWNAEIASVEGDR
jgi:thioredoxin reductase